jgi:hypothetical protein
MTKPITITDVNRELRRTVFEIALGRNCRLRTLKAAGNPFRSQLRTEEGIECEGFDTFDLDSPAGNLDFSRVAMPLDRLAEAIANDEVSSRRFVRQVDQELLLILDVTPSMRYPLRLLYRNELREGRGTSLEDQTRGKASLLKLAAGVFAEAAVADGFIVRIVEFDGRRLIESPPLRNRIDLSWLFERIDRHFRFDDPRPQASPFDWRMWRTTDATESSICPMNYADVAARYLERKAAAVFLGDFMEGASTMRRPPHPDSLRMIRLFRLWGRNRPLFAVRINHRNESEGSEVARSGHPDGDHCATDIESSSYAVSKQTFFEELRILEQRLERYRSWSKDVVPMLRKTCLGYAEIHDGLRTTQIAEALDPIRRRLFS